MYTLSGKIVRDKDVLHEGKDFFRKMTDNENEIKLCEFLMKHPHENIIKIHGVSKGTGKDTGVSKDTNAVQYIDMELLDTDIEKVNKNQIIVAMKKVKKYLQNLGIIYIDWKPDNIGIDEDGNIKLFDFDVSGMIDTETNEWIIEPPKFHSYSVAVHNGMKTPIEIDDYAFSLGIKPDRSRSRSKSMKKSKSTDNTNTNV
jgi:serine/threonine protein kinase